MCLVLVTSLRLPPRTTAAAAVNRLQLLRVCCLLSCCLSSFSLFFLLLTIQASFFFLFCCKHSMMGKSQELLGFVVIRARFTVCSDQWVLHWWSFLLFLPYEVASQIYLIALKFIGNVCTPSYLVSRIVILLIWIVSRNMNVYNYIEKKRKEKKKGKCLSSGNQIKTAPGTTSSLGL